MPYDLYSKQTMSSVKKDGDRITIGFFANQRTSEAKFSCVETLFDFDVLKKYVGKDVLVGISTSGRIFDLEPAF